MYLIKVLFNKFSLSDCIYVFFWSPNLIKKKNKILLMHEDKEWCFHYAQDNEFKKSVHLLFVINITTTHWILSLDDK